MDNLSPEVLGLIVANLYAKPPPPPFPDRRMSRAPHIPYAAVSRKWQHAVEPWIFTRIGLRSNELTTFADIFATPRRRALLRRLEYSVLLPTFGDSRRDFAENQAAFENGIRGLLDILRDWESDDAGSLELWLTFKWNVDMTEGPAEFHFDALNSSSSRRYLMLDGVRLPEVRRLTGLNILSSPGRALLPEAMCYLSNAMPCLEKLELEVLDPVNKRREMRKSHRLAFAAGLTALDLPRLAHLRIHHEITADVYNHSFDCGDLEEDGIDSLNDALRRVSQTAPLASLDLSGILVSSDLFRNRRAPGYDDSSVWPTLRHFNIKAGIIAPSGKWYYTGDPAAADIGSDSEAGDEDEFSEGGSTASGSVASSTESDDNMSRDERANGVRPTHTWREVPDPDVFNSLVRDMAGAVLRMPQLRSGSMEVGTDYGAPVSVILKCAEAGQELVDRPDWKLDSEEERRTRRWHAWVGVVTEWELPEDVKKVWEEWLGEYGKSAVDSYPPGL
ncbi:hypothetical protein F5Y13DRAFT_199837 [Hypoxylon sp. FL1857]|nr:hypothetical protein F5Y13DRAFT_199837 [Hypoxylon sp. FL1857]